VIDTYFKQYFWTFHLVLIALAAFLIARTVNAFVAGALVTPAEAIAAAAPADPNKMNSGPKTDNGATIDAFLNRNIFKAAREDLTPEPEAAPVDTGVVDMNVCDRSAMGAGLIATVVAVDPVDSIAVFEDRAKKEPVTLRNGEKLLEEAELIAIEWRRVLVKHNGRCEEFSLEEEDPSKVIASNVPPVMEATPPAGDAPPVDSELGKDIKKVSESEYEIPRKEIEGVLSNLNTVATQARIVPSFHNGKANGFKLFSIRPGSLYSKIGIQNGDIVQRINGYEINSPDKALEIYSKLKDAQSITVDLVRRGKSQTLSYQIR
jgi:general secretion pathway protein C